MSEQRTTEVEARPKDDSIFNFNVPIDPPSGGLKWVILIAMLTVLGYTGGFVPKFVKKYADLHSVMLEAFKQYKKECEDRSFPEASQTYEINDDVMDKLFEPEF